MRIRASFSFFPSVWHWLTNHSASPCFSLHFWEIMKMTQGKKNFFFLQVAMWFLVNWWCWRHWDIMEILTLHQRDMAAGILLGSLACFMPLNSVIPLDVLLSVQLELLCLDQIKDTYCLEFYLPDNCFVSSSWCPWTESYRADPWAQLWGLSHNGEGPEWAEITGSAPEAYSHQRVTCFRCRGRTWWSTAAHSSGFFWNN